jgi:hypothetical protein
MRTLFSLATMAGLTLGLVAGSFAAEKPAKPAAKAHAKAAAKKCPACGMMLSTKKTKDMPQMVKIGKTTYYCCKACDMSKKDKPHEEHKEKTPG